MRGWDMHNAIKGVEMKILEPLAKDKIHIGCLNCSTAQQLARMEMKITVGFGSAYVTKNGKIYYDGSMAEWEKAKSLSAIERIARRSPDADWRLVMFGPLHGETYQRQGRKRWVMAESNQGFA